MSSIDEQVVQMRFDNKEFESNAQQTLGTLDKLKRALHFDNAGKGLEKLGEEAKQLDFSKVSGQLDNMEKRLSTFGIAGAAAIQRVTNAAMDLGKTIVQDVTKPFTAAVSQIKSGGLSRAMNLEHANFQLEGILKNADKVAAIMGKEGPVQKAVDGTAYGLDAAAVAASSLVASGVKTEELLGPLKAIAGVAAMTGREYSDISDIFTTVASNGKLMTMQLRQLSASGLNASAALAKSLGKSEAEINEMVTKGEISFAQFSNAMMEAFGDHAAEANKTFSGALSNMKAALSRIGEKIATPGLDHLRDIFNELRVRINLFNDLIGQANTPGTAIYAITHLMQMFRNVFVDAIKGERATKFIFGFAKGLNMLATSMEKLLRRGGPAYYFLKGIGNVFKALLSFIRPVAEAFLDIFPPTTIDNIRKAAYRFERFTKTLMASETVANNLRKGFRGVFAVIRSVGEIVHMVSGLIFDFIKALSPVGEVLAAAFGTVGDILSDVAYYIKVVKVAIEYTLSYFNIFEAVGGVIAKVFSSVINLVGSVSKLIWGAFSTVANGILSIFGIVLPPIESAGDVIGLIMEGIVVAISLVLSVIDAVADGINKLASVFFGGADFLKTFNIELDKTSGIFKVLTIPIQAVRIVIGAVFNALYNLMNYIQESGGLFGALSRAFQNMGTVMHSFYDFLKEAFGPIFTTIGKGFGFVASKVREYTKDLTIGKIATAAFVGVMIALAVQVARVIGGVSSLAYGLGKMANETGEVIEAFKWRLRPTFIQRFSKVLHEFAYAVLALTAALVILASTPNVDKALISLGVLAGGLVILTGVMFALSKAMKKAGVTRQMMNLAFTMISIAASLLILVGALKALENINTDGIILKAAAIGVMAVALGVSAGLMSKIAPKLTKGAFGLIFFAIAIKQVVSAMAEISGSSLTDINSSIPVLIAIMGGMALLAVAMGSVKLTSGLGVLLVALAIKLVLPVVKDLIAEAAQIDFSPLTKFVSEYKYELLILGGLAALASVVIKKITEGFKNFAIGMVGVVAAVYLMVKVAKLAGQMDPNVLSQGVKTIVIFMGMVALLMVLSKFTGAAKMISFAAAMGMLALVITQMISVAWLAGQMDPTALDRGMSVVTKFLLMIAGIMALAKLTEKAQPGKIAAMFAALAGAISALIVCIYVIGNMDNDVLVKGSIAVAGMIAILTGVMILTRFAGQAQPGKMAALFAAMAGAILVMTYCIKLLGAMSLGDLAKGAVTVTALLLLMTFIAKSLAKLPNTKNFKKIIVPVAATIALLGSVILALKVVAGMSLGDILKAGITIIALLAFMEKMTEKLSKLPSIQNFKKVLVPVLSVIGMLATIVVAMLLLSTISIEGAIKSILSIIAGMTILIGVIKLVSGIKIDPSAWTAMLASCAMMATVALALGHLADYNWASLLAAAVAMGVCMAAVSLILTGIVSHMRIDWQQIGQFAVGLGALYLVALAIGHIAEYDWKSLLAAAAGINMCIGAYTLVFAMFNQLNIQWEQIGKFALGLATLYLVAVAMSKVLEASQDWRAIMAAAAGLTLCASAIAVVMTFMSLAVKKIPIAALVTFAAACGALYIVALALEKIITAGDYTAIEAAGNALLKAVVAIGLVLIELAAAAALGAAVIAGAPTLAAALVALTGIVVAMGAIYKIPFVKELIESGGELMAALGKAIGGFFGGIVNGFATIASEALPAIGKSMSGFAKESKPFWDLLKSFEGTGVLQAAKDIAGVVLVLTASSLLNAIGDFFSWLFGGDGSFEEMGQNLCTFGKAMADFQDITKNVSASRLHAVGEAGKTLGEVLEILNDQKSGGIFDLFTGTADWKGTLEGLTGYGESMAKLSDEMVKVKPENLAVLKDCAEATKNLVESMPEKHGAIKGLFSSYKDIGGNADDMKKWAESMVAISDAFTDTPINKDAIENATNAAKLVVALANELPEKDGWIKGLFASDTQSLSSFADDMDDFADGIVSFSDKVNGKIDSSAVEAAANAGQLLAALANNMPKTDGGKVLWGLISWGDSQDDLEDFGDTLVPFAEEMVEFSDALTGLNYESLAKFEPTVKALATIMESVAKMAAGDFTTFSNTFKSFGEGLKEFANNSNEIDADKVSQFSVVLDELITVFNKKFGQKFDKFKGLTKFTTSINEVNEALKNITSDRQAELKEFGDTLETFASQYVGFMTGNADVKGVNTINTADVEKFAAQIKILEDAVASSGGKKKKGTSDFSEFAKFAKGLKQAVDAITKLSSGEANVDKSKEEIDKVISSLRSFVSSIKGIKPGDIKSADRNLKSITKMLNDFSSKDINVGDLDKAATKIDNSLSKLVKGLDAIKVKLDTTYFSKLETYGNKVVSHFTKGLTDATGNQLVESACGKVLSTLCDKLDVDGGGKKYKSNLKTVSKHLLNGLKQGVEENIGIIYEVGKSIYEKLDQGVRAAGKIQSPSRKMMEVGKYAVEGLLLGLKKHGKGKIYNSGHKMGDDIMDGINTRLGIHSPATALIEAAKHVVSGWLKGIKSGSGAIFDSGSSFGGGFLNGLKSAISSIKKGDFAGSNILDNLKKKLGVDKLVDAKKDSKNLSDNLGKMMDKATKDAEAKSSRGSGSGGSGSARSKQGDRDAKEYTKAYNLAFIAGLDVLGSELSEKQKKIMANVVGVSLSELNKMIDSYKKNVEAISKDKNFVNAAMTNQTAIKKYAEQVKKNNAYIKKLHKSLNKSVVDGTKVASKEMLNIVGTALGKQTEEYKTAQKNYEKNNKQIVKNAETVAVYLDKLDAYNKKYEAAKDKKDTKSMAKWKKKAESIIKKINTLESKQTELRKKNANEMKKMAAASKKALQTLRKETQELVKSWLDFSNINLDRAGIISTFEGLSDAAEEASSDVDLISDAIDRMNEKTDEAANKFDALSSSFETGLNLFERFTKTGTVEAEALFENADSQLEAYEEFQNGLAELEAKNLDISVIDQLASEGPDALNKIRGFLSMSEDQINSYNERVNKQREYESKALERNLRRQYEQYVKYFDDLTALQVRFGDKYIDVFKAIENSGFSSAGYISALLKMDDAAFAQSASYFAEGLKDTVKLAIDEVADSSEVTESTKKAGKDIWANLADSMEKDSAEKKAFEESYYKAVNEFGLDKGLADALYAKGMDVAKPYFDGLVTALPEDIDRVNDIWKESQTTKTVNMLDEVQAIITKDLKTQESELKSIEIDNANGFTTLLNRFRQRFVEGMQAEGTTHPQVIMQMWNKIGGNAAFEGIVNELKASGKNSEQIYNALVEWIDGDDKQFQKLQDLMNSYKDRTSNTAKITGDTVKKSWNNTIETLKTNSKNFGQVAEKFGDHLTKEVYEYIKGLSPEEIAALNELSPVELQQMADDFWDANKAADAISDNIYNSFMNGTNDAMKRYRSAMSIWDGKDTGDPKKNRTYEFGKWLNEERAQGKTLAQIVEDWNTMSSKVKKSTFKFNAENKFANIKTTMNTISEFLDKNMSDEAIINTLINNGDVIDNLAGWREQFFGEALGSGTEIANIVCDTFDSGVKEGVKKFSYILMSKDNETTKLVKQSFNSGLTSAVTSGSTLSAKAINKCSSNLTKGLKAVSTDATKASADSYKANGQKLGKKSATGVKNGYANGSGTIITKFKTVIKNVYNGVSQTYDDYGYDLGECMADGMANGLVQNSYKIVAAARQAALDAYNAAKAALDSHSPSKKFMQLGEWASEGMAIGMDNKADMIDDSVTSIAESTLTGMRDVIGKLRDAINGDMELSPVITPQLDLSLLNRQVQSTSHLFDARVGLTTDTSQNQDAENQNAAKSVTFVQNNYSPKALSREEIYRQTNNLFARTREAVIV